jgi:hypothetical protein
MVSANLENGLRAALARFEDCIETPVIPGELANWLNDARRACLEVGKALREYARNEHSELLHKMGREDSELLGRVEQLREAEQQLICTFDRLQSRLELLSDRARAVEPDEGKLEKPLADFIDCGLSFVLAARKQDKAIATWYSEALNRDRGVGD